MKRAILATCLGALVSLGCSTGSQPEFSETGKAPLLLGIEGVNAGDLSSALMVISNVDVLADGQPLSVSIDRARADLVRSDQKLAIRFDAPKTARDVEVRIAFDDFGGYTAGSSGGELDTRGALLRFHARADDLVQHGGASVQLDLNRSLVPMREDKRVFVPQFAVR